MLGTPFSSSDSNEIDYALTENPDVSRAEISRRIERHLTTIMRDVTLNGGRRMYRTGAAERRAQRCRKRPRTRRLAEPCELRTRTQNELKLGRSPVVIALDLDAEGLPGRPCVETIYAAVYDGTLGVKARDCLWMRRPRRRSRTERNASKRPALP